MPELAPEITLISVLGAPEFPVPDEGWAAETTEGIDGADVPVPEASPAGVEIDAEGTVDEPVPVAALGVADVAAMAATVGLTAVPEPEALVTGATAEIEGAV